jgi:two-component system sensor histidine kinase RegB
LQHLLSRWQVVRPDARVSLELSPGAARLMPALSESLEQALMNLLNNAADVSPDDVNVHAGTADDALVLDISDRGPGFSPEQKRQAGRTAFSGKPGQGMGVGLALTHATVERLGGTVNLMEREGGGTRVRVRLPLAPGENNG